MSRTTATQWPVHYTAADIEAINALTAWKAENGLSNVQISNRIGTGNAIVSQILRGTYVRPTAMLKRLLASAGLPMPAAWRTAEPPAPAPAPVPAPMVARMPSPLRYGCWQPGEADMTPADAPLRAAILRALRRTTSAEPMPVPELLTRLTTADTKPAQIRAALEALINAREVIRASVTHKGRMLEVVYIMGRIVKAKPGRRAGAIRIVPSQHAKSVHGGPVA